jgi:hypothetical protein
MRKAVELVELDVDRVDGVDVPATGIPFLVLKSATPTPKDLFMAKTTVAKADDPAVADPEDLMDAADDDAAGDGVPTEIEGDPTEPGSPAWEAVDAARARAATQQVVALKELVCELAARETAEASEGEGGADDNAWDLGGVLEALDCALAVLAKFAVDEQSEADQGAADIEDAARDLGLIKSIDTPTSAVDALVTIAKAGRVLSAANEAAVRQASELLNNVLATLPAPVTEEAPVAKDITETPEPAAVEKAKGDPQVAVYDANGKLVGTIDQKDLNPIASAAPPEGGDADGGDAPAEDAAPVADAQTPAPEAAPSAEAPAAPAAPETDDDGTMMKALENPLFKAAFEDLLKARLAPIEELVQKMAAQPAPDATLMHGIVPADLTSADPKEALAKALASEHDPVKRAELQMSAALGAVKGIWSNGR